MTQSDEGTDMSEIKNRLDNELETVGLGFYYEDLDVGRRFKTIGRTVTESDIVNFIITNNS